MNKFLNFAVITAFVLVLGSCSKNDGEKVVDFSVDPVTLNMTVGDEATLTVVPATQTYTFESTATNVATVSTDGVVTAVGEGSATINVVCGSITKTVSVTVNLPAPIVTLDFSTFTDYKTYLDYEDDPPLVSINCVHGKVNFLKDVEIDIAGQVDASKVYNRDFMNYDETTGKLTFTEESGEYDVFYSEKYQYIWVNKQDAKAPDVYWISGIGIFGAPQWNDDMSSVLGWMRDDPRQTTCMKSIGDGKYQAHVYLNWNSAYWCSKFSVYANRFAVDDNLWDLSGAVEMSAITGDTGDYAIDADDGISIVSWSADGYYLMVFDSNTKTLDFKQL